MEATEQFVPLITERYRSLTPLCDGEVRMFTIKKGPIKTPMAELPYGEWRSPSGKLAVWEIRDDALVVTDPDDGKIMVLIPLEALQSALRVLGQ